MSRWRGEASYCMGQVQPVGLFPLEEWRLDVDGLNSCSFLAASCSVAQSLCWSVHKNATLATQQLHVLHIWNRPLVFESFVVGFSWWWLGIFWCLFAKKWCPNKFPVSHFSKKRYDLFMSLLVFNCTWNDLGLGKVQWNGFSSRNSESETWSRFTRLFKI